MKIISINASINFKSNKNNENVLGYDDSVSKTNRDAIRKWHEDNYMPYQKIYDKERRLTDYQLDALLKSMAKKPKVVDYKTMMSIPVYNVKPIDSMQKCFRGATLVNHSDCLPVLKKCGIERVVDLVGYTKYRHEAKVAGLEYLSPAFGRCLTGVWSEPAFQSLSEYLKEELRYCSPIDLKNDKKYISALISEFQKESRESINEFINYIKFLQKGYFYIGCEYGTDRTSDYLLLNEVFNPKAEVSHPELKLRDYVAYYKVDYMYELYKKLTPEDKKELGWTKEYEFEVLKRLF